MFDYKKVHALPYFGMSFQKSLLSFIFGRHRQPRHTYRHDLDYKLLIVLTFFSALGLLLFLSLSELTIYKNSPQTRYSMLLLSIFSLTLWHALRGHHERYFLISILYALLSIAYASYCLVNSPHNEMRLLWALAAIPSLFLLPIKSVCWPLCIAWLVIAGIMNQTFASIYSTEALTTVLLCSLHIGAFTFTHENRMQSYLRKMQLHNIQLRLSMRHDHLTNVLNAATYYQICADYIFQNKRSQLPYSVLFVDLDYFKQINDTHGHAAGDQVLKTVASVLCQTLRETDYLGRIGGEEFSVFLPNTDLGDALRIAESLRNAVFQCNPRVGNTRLFVTASIGVASGPTNSDSLHVRQRRADAAMYEAKKTGRNRVCTYPIAA